MNRVKGLTKRVRLPWRIVWKKFDLWYRQQERALGPTWRRQKVKIQELIERALDNPPPTL